MPFCLGYHPPWSLFFFDLSIGENLLRGGFSSHDDPRNALSMRPDSDLWLKDLRIKEVRSRRSGFTRYSSADPLAAFAPFEDFSL
jgi:hypothetical protein